MIDLSSYRKAFENLPEGVSRAEVNAERIACRAISIRDGRAASSEAYDITKYYVRAGGECLGRVYTEKPDEEVPRLLRQAAACAPEGDAPESMHGPEADREQKEPAPEESIREMIAFGAEAEKLLAPASIQKLSVRVTTREMRTVNTLGLDSSFTTHWVDVETAISLLREGMQDAEAETHLCGSSLASLSPADLAAKALRLCRNMDADGALPVRIAGGKYDCVMTGQVMRNILMTAWRAFSQEAMQAGGSCFAPGEEIGSGAVSLLNAPEHPLSGKVFPVDSEGTPMRETTVVRNGKLEEPLRTLASARKAGADSNGCAGRVPVMTGTVPISLTTVPGFFYLKPDTSLSMEDLVGKMQNGIVLTYSLDLFHSVNIASGLFSVPCGGYLVKDGKPAGSLECVAGDLDFDDFYFRNYCVGSPSVLLRSLTFST